MTMRLFKGFDARSITRSSWLAALMLASPSGAEMIVQTAAEADLTKPLIGAGPTVLSVSDRNAVIHWTTNEVADSRVSYQQAGQTQPQTAGDIDQWVIEHFVVLSKLSAGAQYNFSVQSQDAAGNLSEPSQSVDFTTAAQPDSTSPQIQGLPTIGTVTANSVQISWTTDEVSRGRVEFGPDSTHLNRSADQQGYGTAHAVTMAGLSAGQTYYFQVVSTDPSANAARSETASVTTATDGGAGPDPNTPPVPTQAPQTIEFGAIADQPLAAQHVALSATASSGLPVTFESATAETCTVDGNTVDLVAAGICTILANQAGNNDYQAAATVSRSFAVLAKTPQTISLANPGAQVFGKGGVTLTASASSGLPVLLSSETSSICSLRTRSQLQLKSPGTCTVRAMQNGNGAYSPAEPVSISFEITQASQTIRFNSSTPAKKSVGTRPFRVTAKASSNLMVSFRSDSPTVCSVSSAGLVKVLSAGTCSVVGTQAGNRNYLPAEDQTMAITVR
jgi:hypothetical protein